MDVSDLDREEEDQSEDEAEMEAYNQVLASNYGNNSKRNNGFEDSKLSAQ